MSLKLWECLRSRNPGWFCLYCSISECVLNQSQQTRTVSFSHRRTHIFIHKEKSAMHSSPCLSPSWPQLLSPSAPVLVCGYQSLPLFMKCGSGSNELPKRDPVKPSDTQSVITDGIHGGWWVLMCRHVVCKKIAVCLCSRSCLHVMLCIASPVTRQLT